MKSWFQSPQHPAPVVLLVSSLYNLNRKYFSVFCQLLLACKTIFGSSNVDRFKCFKMAPTPAYPRGPTAEQQLRHHNTYQSQLLQRQRGSEEAQGRRPFHRHHKQGLRQLPISQRGYTLQFTAILLTVDKDSTSSMALSLEICSLLQKAIENVPPLSQMYGFYST